MLPNPFTRLRSSISLMVLLAVCITLLPAQRGAAQNIPIPMINLTPEEARIQGYQWWVDYQFENRPVYTAQYVLESHIQSALVADHLLHDTTALYDIDVVLKQADALQERYYQRLGDRGTDPAYRATLPNSVLGEALFAAALENPVFKYSAKRVYQKLRDEASALLDLRLDAPIRAFHNEMLEGNLLDGASRTLFQEKIDRVLERAETDPQFVKAWDKYFAPEFGLKLENFDVRTFLAAHPEVPVPQQIRDAVRPDGSMSISLEALHQLAQTEFGNINASIDDIQKTLVQITAQQGELVDFMRDEQKRRQAEALAEAKAREHQLRIQAAGASVSIIANLISIADPEAGKQFATIGYAAVTIGDSLRNWMEAVAGLNGIDKLTSLSTVVMTGNVLGAVLSIMSLFGESQPTPDQIILEEIGKLRQQVNELRTEMHDRFDRVDAQLNTIYTTMHQRFDQIDIQLGKLNGKLDEIQQSLLTLGMALSRLERNNFEYLDAIGRRPLREAINGALGYQERTGLPMPYQPEFVGYENVFHTWGRVNAFDALSAGPTERDYSDAAVLAELSAAPLDANVNYLNGWLVARGMPPFTNKRLPGLRDWTFAGRAYAELGFEWPAHLKRISGQRQAALDAVGNDLQQALQNISTIQTPNGPQGNAPLWNGLTDYYKAKLQGLDNALIASEATYVGELQATLKRAVPLDLYGGLDQTLPYPYRPDDFTTMTCGGQGAPETRLATPHHLKNLITSYDRFALADYLGVSPLKVCAYAGWDNLDPPCVAGPGTCNRYGEVKVVLVVFADNKASLGRHSLVGPRRLHSDANIWSVIAPEWNTYWKRGFELNFQGRTPLPLSPEAAKVLESVSSATVSKLVELQRTHSRRVLNELNSGALRTSAVELAGAKKLLESFITLGFPRVIAGDDFLRSLLFSKESLVDDQQVAGAYATPVSATPSVTEAMDEADLLLNPRVRLLQTAQKRREALSGLLTDYLGSISTESYREDVALISGTRFDLQLARTFADPNTPVPGQSQVVFLPLVRR